MASFLAMTKSDGRATAGSHGMPIARRSRQATIFPKPSFYIEETAHLFLKKIIIYLTARIYKPLLVKYLSSAKTYTYKGMRLLIPAGVFHPGFFFSTQLLLRYIEKQSLKNKSFLELGAGSGLISFFAARNGAVVTATDINPTAIEYLQKNSAANGISIDIIHSDLFSHIPVQSFEIIAINPPYYRKNPSTDAEYAWYCGENGEYFNGLFSSLAQYTHNKSAIWMILCDGCDIEMIRGLATGYGWNLRCVFERKNLVEKNFIFKIESITSPSHKEKTNVKTSVNSALTN
jgi:release factor glutamine methyltransferase